MYKSFKNTRSPSFIVLEELLLLTPSNVVRRLGPVAHFDYALLDELAKLLLMAAFLRAGVVTEIFIIDLNESIGRLYIAACICSCFSIGLSLSNHEHVTLISILSSINRFRPRISTNLLLA
jgi:hypothetical protein